MPNVLALKRKSDGKLIQGGDLIELDDTMCVDLGIKPHPSDFYLGWIDNIGYSLATGKSFDELREWAKDWRVEERAVVEYLAERFDNASYYSR